MSKIPTGTDHVYTWVQRKPFEQGIEFVLLRNGEWDEPGNDELTGRWFGRIVWEMQGDEPLDRISGSMESEDAQAMFDMLWGLGFRSTEQRRAANPTIINVGDDSEMRDRLISAGLAVAPSFKDNR